ncbi:MAG: hypothetical protein HC905_14410 [Bacteroidales bacterium]|nr:hypothetical protein [Bacteroidales bacterium]
MKTFLNAFIGLLIFLSLVSSFSGCKEPESYSEIPYIEFESYRVFDTVISGLFNQRKVEIRFSFVDGDGDIGYRQDIADTTKKKIFTSADTKIEMVNSLM